VNLVFEYEKAPNGNKLSTAKPLIRLVGFPKSTKTPPKVGIWVVLSLWTSLYLITPTPNPSLPI
jgi:hypothetical protein